MSIQSKPGNDLLVPRFLNTYFSKFVNTSNQSQRAHHLIMPKGQTKSQSSLSKNSTNNARKKRSRTDDDLTTTEDSQNKVTSSPLRKKITRTRSVKEQPLIDSSNVESKDKQLDNDKTEDANLDSNISSKDEPSNDNITIDGTAKAVVVKPEGSSPVPRWGHSFCFIQNEKAILIGGQREKQQLCKDSLWMYDDEYGKWSEPETKFEGSNPEMRVGHSATYHPAEQCIYVFGGSKNKRWFSDVHVLDLNDFEWKLIKTEGNAPTRAYHSATLYRNELWIFGGVFPQPDPQPDKSSNEIHIYSPLTESWYTPIVTGSERPDPRSGHSATLINDELVIFGGWDFPYCFNDINILDMSIVEWTKPVINGTPPTPRSWHSACSLYGNRIAIHGGYNGNIALSDTAIFNVDTKTWFNVKIDQPMICRAGHTIVCSSRNHDNRNSDEIIIFGGGDNDGAFFDDLMRISLSFS